MSPGFVLSTMLAAQTLVYPLATDEDRQFASALELKGRASWQTAGGDVELALAPRFVWDPADDSRNRFLPTEAWVRATAGAVDLRAGLLQFEWGKSELFRPTDRLNQRDYGGGLFRSIKLAELGVTATAHGGPVLIEAVWLPLFQHPMFPADNADVGADLGGFDGLRLSLGQGFEAGEVNGASTMTFAGRALLRTERFELETVWLRGPSRLPAPWLDDLTLRSHVYPVDMLGGSVALLLDPVTLRAEAARLDSGLADDFFIDENPRPWDVPIPGT